MSGIRSLHVSQSHELSLRLVAGQGGVHGLVGRDWNGFKLDLSR